MRTRETVECEKVLGGETSETAQVCAAAGGWLRENEVEYDLLRGKHMMMARMRKDFIFSRFNSYFRIYFAALSILE